MCTCTAVCTRADSTHACTYSTPCLPQSLRLSLDILSHLVPSSHNVMHTYTSIINHHLIHVDIHHFLLCLPYSSLKHTPSATTHIFHTLSQSHVIKVRTLYDSMNRQPAIICTVLNLIDPRRDRYY